MDHRGLSGICIALLALALGAASPARAQDNPAPMVKATDAKALLKTLREAGYKAKFEDTNDAGEQPSIEITLRDGPVYVVFSDCDEAVPAFCETVVLSTSWDRTTPMSDAAITEANYRFKYVSVFRDETGDPVMQWAILTRDIGISQPLFLNALQRYLEIVRDFTDIAFDGDEDPEPAPAAATADAGGALAGFAK